jgi:Trp operon repressor
MADEKQLKLTTYVRKELTFDRDELRSVLSMFLNWSESNELIAIRMAIIDEGERQDMIDRFIAAMAGENIEPSERM